MSTEYDGPPRSISSASTSKRGLSRTAARSQAKAARKDAKASLAIFDELGMRRYALRASALLTQISMGTAPEA